MVSSVSAGSRQMAPPAQTGGGLRVSNPADIRHQHPQGGVANGTRGGFPRRHTLTGGIDNVSDTNPKYRTLQMAPASQQYAQQNGPAGFDKSATMQGRVPVRHPSAGGQSPHPGVAWRGNEDTMSIQSEADYSHDSGEGGFERGGRLRSSLPIVRSPNRSMEKPLGLVFLVYRGQTVRMLLPNEVTTMETVRALFVRAFPAQLTMSSFAPHQRRAVFVMKPDTQIFSQLVDMRDVSDRCVLELTEGVDTRKNTATAAHSQHGYESDSSVKSAPPGVEVASSPVRRAYRRDLHAAPAHQVEPQYAGGPPPPQTWSPGHRLYQAPQGGAQVNRSSPMHTATLPPGQELRQHAPVNNLAHAQTLQRNDNRVEETYGRHGYQTTQPMPQPAQTPYSKSRMDKMEAQLANLAAWVHTAVRRDSLDGATSGVGGSTTDCSYSTKSKVDSSEAEPMVPPGVVDGIQPGMTDISSLNDIGPAVSAATRASICNLRDCARNLRTEVNDLRRLHLSNSRLMKDAINDTFLKFKQVVSRVPGAKDQPVRLQRQKVDVAIQEYRDNAASNNKELNDLEASVEEVRNDVINKKCRVSMKEVESMALTLSGVSRSLADLKGRFPQLQDSMKQVMAGEMEIVVEEEQFLKDEPVAVEKALRKCKSITSTLSTLKKLCAMQENRNPEVPTVTTKTDTEEEDRRAILDNILAMVPDHEARLQSLQVAAESRERKKKMTTTVAARRFEKSLEMAHKQLRETTTAAQQAKVTDQGRDTPSKPPRSTPPPISPKPVLNRPSNPRESPVNFLFSAAEPCTTTQNSAPRATRVASPAPSPPPPLQSPPAAKQPKSHLGAIATSTPKSHVTFSSSVTEISQRPLSPPAEFAGKRRPPAPPPRKSSRNALSPVHGAPARPPTPDDPVVSDKPKSVSSPRKPMTKFQRELAAGIYANINRPDLQEQRLNHSDVVDDVAATTAAPLSAGSDSGSSASIDSQLGGVAPTNHVTKASVMLRPSAVAAAAKSENATTTRSQVKVMPQNASTVRTVKKFAETEIY